MRLKTNKKLNGKGLGKGWHNDSIPHSLAAKGIKSRPVSSDIRIIKKLSQKDIPNLTKENINLGDTSKYDTYLADVPTHRLGVKRSDVVYKLKHQGGFWVKNDDTNKFEPIDPNFPNRLRGMIKNIDKLPPPVYGYDDGKFDLEDGTHRAYAHVYTKRPIIRSIVVVKKGVKPE